MGSVTGVQTCSIPISIELDGFTIPGATTGAFTINPIGERKIVVEGKTVTARVRRRGGRGAFTGA
ncbi:hypothetical protein PJM45_28950, partial [Mycobacterium kansasii]